MEPTQDVPPLPAPSINPDAQAAHSGSASDSDDGYHTPDPQSAQFGPTVPRSQSGSPHKSPSAPLDPQWPQAGMFFNAVGDIVHFVYIYERRRGYEWKKGESERNEDSKLFMSILAVKRLFFTLSLFREGQTTLPSMFFGLSASTTVWQDSRSCRHSTWQDQVVLMCGSRQHLAFGYRTLSPHICEPRS